MRVPEPTIATPHDSFVFRGRETTEGEGGRAPRYGRRREKEKERGKEDEKRENEEREDEEKGEKRERATPGRRG